MFSKFYTALLVCLAVKVIRGWELECRNVVSCPCGSSRENVTVCVSDASAYTEVCARLSKCESCEEGSNVCLKCLEGLENVICSQEKNKPRQKRYMSYPRLFREKPWTGSQQNCPYIDSPKFGSIRCISNSDYQTCTGTCFPGYHFTSGTGNKMTLTCQRGVWTPMSSFPECRSEGFCDLIATSAGAFNCNAGIDGTCCDVDCFGRYQGRFYCYPGQEWEPPLPRCVEPKPPRFSLNYCPYPGGIVNGQVIHMPWLNERRGPSDETEKEYPEGSQLQYSCGDGYDIEGSDILTCQNTGRWSSTPPTCKKASRSSLTDCPYPGGIVNGQVVYIPGPFDETEEEYPEGSQLQYSCDDEYDIEGSPTLTCQNTGRWSSTPPTCKKASLLASVPLNYCFYPGDVNNGRFVRVREIASDESEQEYPEGSQVQYSCDDGYNLEGSPTLTCESTGEWSSTLPTCIRDGPLTCMSLGFFSNGQVVHQNVDGTSGVGALYLQGSRLNYFCNTGYALVGSPTLVCEETGLWSAEQPICRERSSITDCPYPGGIVNGQVFYIPGPVDETGDEYPEGSQLQYSCDDGYYIVGFDVLTCQNTSRWSSTPPTCKNASVPQAKCSFMPYIENARVVRERKTVFVELEDDSPSFQEAYSPEGSQIEFSCFDGYNMVGSPTVICESTGRWSSTQPTCERDEQRTCEESGERIRNGDYVHQTADGGTPSDGSAYLIGHRLVYSCDTGYTVAGSATLVCEETGVWSAEKPICQALPGTLANCDFPGNLVDGETVYVIQTAPDEGEYDYPEGSQVQYSCHDGYNLVGSPNRICESTGMWSGDEPECERDEQPDCEIGEIFLDGNYIHQTADGTPSVGDLYLVGHRLVFYCSKGYILVGSSTLVCEETGLWSAEQPICQRPPGTCGFPGTPFNGQFVLVRGKASNVSDDLYPIGTQLQYSCDNGYIQEGSPTLTCEDTDMWSDSLPLCRRVCKSLDVISNGQAEHQSYDDSPVVDGLYLEGDRLIYSCDEGYKLEGSRTLYCEQTGNWFPEQPVCRKT